MLFSQTAGQRVGALVPVTPGQHTPVVGDRRRVGAGVDELL
ncbi:hypothetical protein [Mycobacterium sp.]|nr:hypothetical protein [Mycobacterium sp.]